MKAEYCEKLDAITIKDAAITIKDAESKTILEREEAQKLRDELTLALENQEMKKMETNCGYKPTKFLDKKGGVK